MSHYSSNPTTTIPAEAPENTKILLPEQIEQQQLLPQEPVGRVGPPVAPPQQQPQQQQQPVTTTEQVACVSQTQGPSEPPHEEDGDEEEDDDGDEEEDDDNEDEPTETVVAELAAVVVHHTSNSSDGNNNNNDNSNSNSNNQDDNSSNPNKWSMNGFGASVQKQSGKFSAAESELVKKAVKEYCAAKQITTARLCSDCDHKAELKGAWMEIAKKLPHRSVQSVYRHGIRQLHPFQRGAWTDAECTQLLDLVTKLGKKWSAIQGKLHRSADSCRDKYREMSEDFVKGRWKESETELLQKLIRESLPAQAGAAGITDLAALATKVEEEKFQIPWSTISKRMGKRSRLSCFKKWQKMTAGITLTTTAAVAAGAAVAGTITRITPPSPTTLPLFESSPPPPASIPPAAAADEESIKRVHDADSNSNTVVHANNQHADKNNHGQVLTDGLDKEETGTSAVVSVAGAAANAADSLSLALEASSPPAAKRIKLEPTTPSVKTAATATGASHPAPHANDNDGEGEDTDGDDSEYEDCEEEQEEEEQQQQHDEEVVTGVAEEFDEMYSAKMADETVKALGLPDTEALI